MLHGGKTTENRKWNTTYRGPLIIHGALSYDREAIDVARDIHGPAATVPSKTASPVGYLGLVDLVSVCTDDIRLGVCSCGPWAFAHQNHWKFSNPRPFPSDRIIPGGGRLQLWDPPQAVKDLCVELGLWTQPVEWEHLTFDSLDDLIEPIVTPRALPLMPAGVNSSFDAFHHHNPWVFRALERLAADWLARGNTRIGVKGLFEVLRYAYGTKIGPGSEPIRLNNSHTSRYARLLLEAHPEWSTAIELRDLRAAA